MNALWYYAIGFIVIWILAFILRNKLNITMQGFVLMLKTEKLHNIIDKIAKRAPRFWKAYMNLGIPVGIFFLVLMIISLIWSLQLMFETPTVSLILPGVDIPGSPLYIPFATGMLALATVLIIHEGGHGVLARVEGISIDSVGLLLFAIIPGAFVEPNEEELKKANGMSKLRVYMAGPMFNLGLAAIAMIIMMCIGGFIASENIYTTDGMEITSVVPGSPSEGILEEGMVIQAVNNQSARQYNQYVTVLNKTKIGDNISITTDKGTYNIISSSSPNNSSKSYIGVRSKAHTIVAPVAEKKYGTFIPWLLSQLRELFYLIFLLNFAVGTFNLLPMKPLDGGLILEELVGYRIRDDRRKEFNTTLSNMTRFLPDTLQTTILNQFNNLLTFLHAHELEEETVTWLVNIISRALLAILVLLIFFGLVPGILKMF